MEGKETDREHKSKLKKKRKLEEEELLDYDDVKKKKKRKKTDEEEEKEEENKDNDNIHTKRRRKDSESDSDWFVRHKSNTELIKVRALNKKEITEQENELVIHPKKKKKKKMKYEKRIEDCEYFPVKTKKKKKKRKETVQETDMSSSTYIAEKKNQNRREEEGKREENIHSPIEHTFLKPFPVQERRKGGGQTGKENERRRKAWHNRDQRMKERRDETDQKTNTGRRETDEKGRDETDSDQKINRGEERETGRRDKIDSNTNREEGRGGIKTKNIEENEKEDREEGKKKLTGVISRLAYNGMLGWETDTSVDDLDYSDEDYHLPPAVLKQHLREERARGNRQECVIYSEGENIEGFVPDPR